MATLLYILQSLGGWNWLILALVLLGLEFVVPGVHFMWFGAAAVLVGVVALTTGIDWQWQVGLFGLLSLAAIALGQRFLRPELIQSDTPNLNERGSQYLGRVVVIEDAIVGGRGRARVGDSLWQVEGPDLPAGTRVRVTGSRGTVLVVERAPA